MPASQRIVAIQAPALPPGITYGRGWSGCLWRSTSSAGNISRYGIRNTIDESANRVQNTLVWFGSST